MRQQVQRSLACGFFAYLKLKSPSALIGIEMPLRTSDNACRKNSVLALDIM